MLIINGKKYIAEKELASKCGLSIFWFRKARYAKCSPPYCKLNNRIYYEEKMVDEWLKSHLIESA